jgi:hypothetical protein
MMKKHLCAAVLAMTSQLAASAEQTIVCPPELPAASLRIAAVPQGWKPFISSQLYLHDAAPIAGPPEQLGTLVGKMVKHSKTEWTDTYDLDYPAPEGKWFMCGYGVGNEFTISKRLDDSTKSCVIKGKKGEKFGQHIFDITCK